MPLKGRPVYAKGRSISSIVLGYEVEREVSKAPILSCEGALYPTDVAGDDVLQDGPE